jgi:hypothetical protein
MELRGLMSPVLYTIDSLLWKLSKSCLGCHSGTQFCGTFGYADDLILLAPTVHGLQNIFNICADYTLKLTVLFNPTKTNLIKFGIVGPTKEQPEYM